MTKKITELLKVLNDEFSDNIYYCVGQDLKIGKIYGTLENRTYYEWDDEEEKQKVLTYGWNQLTGDNLKDIVWII